MRVESFMRPADSFHEMSPGLSPGQRRSSRRHVYQVVGEDFRQPLEIARIVILHEFFYCQPNSLLRCHRTTYIARHPSYKLSRKNCVTRFISTLRAAGSLTPWPRPGNGITSTYFPKSISLLISESVFAKCTLSSPVPCAMSSLPFNPSALSIGEEAR